jgi:hypothetical protein
MRSRLYPIIVTCCLLAVPVAVASRSASTPAPEIEQVSYLKLLLRVANVPYQSPQDMQIASELIRWIRDNARGPGVSGKEDSAADRLSEEMLAFLSTKKKPGERWSIVSFARSDNIAIRRLRDEISLPAPSGGAVLRVYTKRSAMPDAIRGSFVPGAVGVTWGRFIAVCTEGIPSSRVAEIIAHEMAHAYVNSCTIRPADLPKWFGEGLALYVSDLNAGAMRFILGENNYSSDNSFAQLVFDIGSARCPDEEAEHSLAFRYLCAVLGKSGLALFIRQSVEQGSLDEPMITVFGTTSHSALMAKAHRWERNQRLAILGIGLVCILFLLFLWRDHKHFKADMELCDSEDRVDANVSRVGDELDRFYKREQAGAGLHEQAFLEDKLESLALSLIRHGHALTDVGLHSEAEQRFDAASHLAPWSSIVKNESRPARGSTD